MSIESREDKKNMHEPFKKQQKIIYIFFKKTFNR